MSGPGYGMAGGRRVTGITGLVLGQVTPGWIAEQRRATRRYLFTTTIKTDQHINRVDPLLEGYLDAADECRHGNLPHNNRCHCWQQTGD